MGREWIVLGVVGKAFGIRGEVRIRPYNPRSTWLDGAEAVRLRKDEGAEPAEYKILKRRRHKEYVVLALDGIRDRDAVEALRGFEAVAREDELPALDADEFYWFQLVGLRVVDGAGREIGRVARIEETEPELDGNDIFVVQGDAGEVLVPATKDAVEEIDVKAGTMRLRQLS